MCQYCPQTAKKTQLLKPKTLNLEPQSGSLLTTHLTPCFVTVQVLLVLSNLGEDVPVELKGEAALLAHLDLLRLQGVLH